MTYQDLIEKLKDLQDVLSQKFASEAEIRDIPKSLATKTELVNRLKKSYIDKNEQYEQVKQRIKGLKERMFEAEQSREKLESQMDMIKTQREYEVLDKEIRDASEKEMQSRKDLQKEEKTLEEMSIMLEKEMSLINEQEEDFSQEQAKIKNETDQKRKQLGQLEKEEAKISKDLDSDILFKFERIIRNKAGSGIVPLNHGVCSGCHMRLPVQFVNDVRLLGDLDQNDREFEDGDLRYCPYCSRVLFYQDDGEDAPDQESSEGFFDNMSFDDEEADSEESDSADEEADDEDDDSDSDDDKDYDEEEEEEED